MEACMATAPRVQMPSFVLDIRIAGRDGAPIGWVGAISPSFSSARNPKEERYGVPSESTATDGYNPTLSRKSATCGTNCLPEPKVTLGGVGVAHAAARIERTKAAGRTFLDMSAGHASKPRLVRAPGLCVQRDPLSLQRERPQHLG